MSESYSTFEQHQGLEAALVTRLPTLVSWRRESYTVENGTQHGVAFIATSPASSPTRALEIDLRPDGDVDIRFWLEGIAGSPFEAHFVVHKAAVDDASDDIASVVQEIVTEKRVLAWDKRPFQGGRMFMTPGELGRHPLRHLKWVVSWNGTLDRGLSAAG